MLLRYASVIGAELRARPARARSSATSSRTSATSTAGERLGEFVGWEGDDVLRFRHDLFRATAYEGLSFRRRREIHRRVGDGARAARRGARRRAGGAPLAALPRGAATTSGPGATPSPRATARARRSRTSSRPSCTTARSRPPTQLELTAAEVARVAEALGDVCELFAAYERADGGVRARRSGSPRTAPTSRG